MVSARDFEQFAFPAAVVPPQLTARSPAGRAEALGTADAKRVASGLASPSADTFVKSPDTPPPTVTWGGLAKAAVCVSSGIAAAHVARSLATRVWEPSHTMTQVATLGAFWGVLSYAKDLLFGLRPDGELVKHSTIMRRMMPYIMPRRNDAWIIYTRDYDLSKTMPFIEQWNDAHDDAHQITLFHVSMGAFIWANQLHPGLNRFVKGGKLFTRNEMSVAFAVKSERKQYAPLRMVKFRAIVGETFEDMVLRINQAVDGERKTRTSNALEKEMKFFLSFDSVLAGLIKLQDFLDNRGMWPASLIHGDPLYASIVAANLGSLHATEMPDVTHHLYEYGTASLFAAICGMTDIDGKHPTIRVNWTYDERVADAHYCLSPLVEGKTLLENPAGLLEPVTAERLAEQRRKDNRASRAAVEAEQDKKAA